MSRYGPAFETADETLKRVRAQSCYGALRVVIWFIVLPGYLLSVLFVIAAGGNAGLAAFGKNIMGAAGFVGGAALYLILAVITFVLTVATHQAMRLLADIADLMIEQVRRK